MEFNKPDSDGLGSGTGYSAVYARCHVVQVLRWPEPESPAPAAQGPDTLIIIKMKFSNSYKIKR